MGPSRLQVEDVLRRASLGGEAELADDKVTGILGRGVSVEEGLNVDTDDINYRANVAAICLRLRNVNGLS